ncbi:hypothetical protein GEMRC1_004814 [Eukaryota sp. GEM-RC1]
MSSDDRIIASLSDLKRDLSHAVKLMESLDRRLTVIEENTKALPSLGHVSFARRPSSIAPDTLSQFESMESFPPLYEHPSAYTPSRPHSPSELIQKFRKLDFLDASSVLSPEDAVKLKEMVTDVLHTSGLFKLLYRASEHGFRAVDFHHHVDDHPNVLVIVNTSDNHVMGGFSPVAFGGSPGHKPSPGAFLFASFPLMMMVSL